MDNVSIDKVAGQQLQAARLAAAGRSAYTVHGGDRRMLRQTVIALAAGRRLGEHDNPGEATLYVLHGQVRLITGQASRIGSSGDLLVVPNERHSLEAIDDCAVLLTAVTRE